MRPGSTRELGVSEVLSVRVCVWRGVGREGVMGGGLRLGIHGVVSDMVGECGLMQIRVRIRRDRAKDISVRKLVQLLGMRLRL